jgi:hypothetical protein
MEAIMKKLLLSLLLLTGSTAMKADPPHLHAFNGSIDLLDASLAGLGAQERNAILDSGWNDMPNDHPYYEYANGKSVAEVAVINNHPQIIDRLVNGYAYQLPDNILHTAADFAIGRGRFPQYYPTIKRLLEHRVDPNYNQGGNTVLHKISGLDYYPSAFSAMELFVQNGANLLATNEVNETPLDIYLNQAQHGGEARVEQLRALRTRNNRQANVTAQIEDAIEEHFPLDDDGDMPDLEEA